LLREGRSAGGQSQPSTVKRSDQLVQRCEQIRVIE
jgi:hypothetical protein